MAADDWAINLAAGGGADSLSHATYQNALVVPELPRPAGDDWCRRIHNDGGASRGHAVFLYNRAGNIPAIGDDVSISMAMCLAPRAIAGEHSVGIGVRLSNTIVSGPGNNPYIFAQDGYHLTVTPGAPDYTIKLVKAIGGVVVQTLWSTTRSGVLDTYKWFHLRLDMLVQINDDLKFLVYENNLSVNNVDQMEPTGPISWGTAIADVEVPSASAYAGAGNVGFGCQCVAGSNYDHYLDRVVIQKYSNP